MPRIYTLGLALFAGATAVLACADNGGPGEAVSITFTPGQPTVPPGLTLQPNGDGWVDFVG
jgi:hypothetical protein